RLVLGAALALSFGVVVSTQAQTAPQDQQATQSQAPAPKAKAKLNLTDEQKAQAKKIHEDAKAKMDAINNDSTLNADQKKAKLREVRHEAHKQFVSMLTPEQRQQMRANKRERVSERRQQKQSGTQTQNAPPQS